MGVCWVPEQRIHSALFEYYQAWRYNCHGLGSRVKHLGWAWGRKLNKKQTSAQFSIRDSIVEGIVIEAHSLVPVAALRGEIPRIPEGRVDDAKAGQ